MGKFPENLLVFWILSSKYLASAETTVSVIRSMTGVCSKDLCYFRCLIEHRKSLFLPLRQFRFSNINPLRRFASPWELELLAEHPIEIIPSIDLFLAH